MKIKVIKNGKLIDGTGNPPLEDSVVVVDGSRIVSVGKKISQVGAVGTIFKGMNKLRSFLS